MMEFFASLGVFGWVAIGVLAVTLFSFRRAIAEAFALRGAGGEERQRDSRARFWRDLLRGWRGRDDAPDDGPLR